ncbi:uncharacterized protein MONBRDRAFT_29749 [Monosiga brevicollis MX1]|uniref:BRCT domain-containing protein n=1 Tax=Monosiga brevicollis TaxID=81824 RepID=A9VC06_MONBE|nr:uncharacterized protein MONBRDRAFT_29749 [Monosiga brevicollis MX1]EDQ84941.1 predicted protein [Monosiga brevicollis MX1]|eukprot:XP_001750282.1 hypothetical protein [Monosiga brevicollis MX1]
MAGGVKVQHVINASPSAQGFPPEHVLDSDPGRVWKGLAGVTNWVELQLDRAVVIETLDVGNYGSAMLEVKVRNSGASDSTWANLCPVELVLPPSASKSWDASQLQNVLFFGQSKINQQARQQRWDQLRLVCKQPYNKTEPFGLTFVRVHEAGASAATAASPAASASPKAPSKPASATTTPTKPTLKREGTFGMFKLKSQPSTTSPPNSIERMRSLTASSSKADRALSEAAENARLAAEARQQAAEERRVREAAEHAAHSLPTTIPQQPTTSSWVSTAVSRTPPAASTPQRTAPKPSAAAPPPKRSKPAPTAPPPYRDILKGVRFTLSGYQNPRRGQLRDLALGMGAQYAAQWDSRCTHSISAFEQTPKNTQARRDGGIIVSKDWLESCDRAKRRVQEYRFMYPSDQALQGGDPDDSAEEEEDAVHGDDDASDDDFDPGAGISGASAVAQPPGQAGASVAPPQSKAPKGAMDVTAQVDAFEADTEPESEPEASTSASATAAPPARANTAAAAPAPSLPRSATTTSVSKSVMETLPDALTGLRILLYGFDDNQSFRAAKRLVYALNATVEDYMSDNVTHVVSPQSWNADFDAARQDNANLVFVTPAWLQACMKQQQRVPESGFQLDSMDE